MVHDKKIIAACGETELANPKKTIITMMQVSPVVKSTDKR
jgi:chitin synthase